MTDIYVINPTDSNSTRSFSVSPYTTNGETTPVSNVLDVSAVSANTSLLFHGKGKDSYGERIQENFYHLLEHFSGSTEPNNPTHGQIWYDTNDSTLKMFSRDGINICGIDNISLNSVVLQITGNQYSRYFSKKRDAAVLRFNTTFKFSVYSETGDFVGDYVSTSAGNHPTASDKIVVNLNTISGIVPAEISCTVIHQTIGEWTGIQSVNPTILENIFTGSTTLHSTFEGINVDLDMGSNYITNLPTLPHNIIVDVPNPTDEEYYWAVNKGYVDQYFLNLNGGVIDNNLTIGGNLVIGSGSLNVEVELAALNNSLNTHNHDAVYVKLDGTSNEMSGFLTLPSLLSPSLDNHAATKKYVDDLIGGVGGVPSFDGLTDVIVAGAAIGDYVTYDGANWINTPTVDATTLNGLADTDYIKATVGGTVSTGGVLKLLGQPGQIGNLGIPSSEDAVTHQHLVDTLAADFASILPNGDIYVVGGSYNGGSDELTLIRTGGQPDIIIPGIAAGVGSNINDTNTIGHTIIPLQQGDGDFLETAWSNDASFPTFILSNIIESLSETIKRMQQRVLSGVIVSDGRVTSYNIDADLGMAYTGGFNSVQIYVNGLKYIPNHRGFQELVHNTGDVFHSTATGLADDPTIYSFNINVDGAGNQLVSFSGAQAQNYRLMADTINTEMISSSIPARCFVYEGVVSFFTDSNGASSTINITDISLVGNLTNMSLDTPVAGATYDYQELTEFGNTDGALILFESTIPTSSLIECVALNVGGATDSVGFEV